MAMSLAALVSFYLLIRQSNSDTNGEKPAMHKILEAPLFTAGSIILITGAGGAYGGMIRLSGVGDVIAHHATHMDFVLLSFGMGNRICSNCSGFCHCCHDYRGWTHGFHYRGWE